MKADLRYGDELIRYEVRRQRERRSSRVAIHVTPDGQVLVDAPMDAADQQIRAAVAAREMDTQALLRRSPPARFRTAARVRQR